MRAGRIVVIGVGNQYRRDDAVGLVVARRLRELAPAGVTIVEAEGEGTSLIDAWRGADAVIIVDAVRSGASPGTRRRMDGSAGRIGCEVFRASTHAVNPADALELARALGELPERAVVFGIEAASFEAGVGLSEPVRRAVDTVVDAVLREIEALREPSRA